MTTMATSGVAAYISLFCLSWMLWYKVEISVDNGGQVLYEFNDPSWENQSSVNKMVVKMFLALKPSTPPFPPRSVEHGPVDHDANH